MSELQLLPTNGLGCFYSSGMNNVAPRYERRGGFTY